MPVHRIKECKIHITVHALSQSGMDTKGKGKVLPRTGHEGPEGE